MAYRLNGTDPFIRFSPGTLTGVNYTRDAFSYAMLIKRIAASSWQGLFVIDNGSTSNRSYKMEFNPSNQFAGDFTTANPFNSTATFNNTTDWMIVGFTNGAIASGSLSLTWRYKIGSGSWSSEAETSPGSNTNTIAGSDRLLIGNEASLGDDANYDICCLGAIESELDQATFESLDMTSFSTWESVFTGSNAWLIGFEDIGTQSDRNGNGGDELSRSGSITLVSDPAGWSWGAAGGTTGFIPRRMPLGV